MVIMKILQMHYYIQILSRFVREMYMEIIELTRIVGNLQETVTGNKINKTNTNII